jgi:hypothetical protein
MAAPSTTSVPAVFTEADDRDEQVREATRRVLEVFQALRITPNEGRTVVRSLQSMNAARRRWWERAAPVLGYFLAAGWALQLLRWVLFD